MQTILQLVKLSDARDWYEC